MSLHYLLDGYNIINQMPIQARKSLRDRRDLLVHWIGLYRPQGSSKNAMTIVFDGKRDVVGQSRSEVAKLIFTSDETADDKIKELVAQSNNKKTIVVVTDDRDIKYTVRSQGAGVMSVGDFLGKLKPKVAKIQEVHKRLAKTKPSAKYISKSLEEKITSEFEEIWLKRKNKTGH